jgi:hypothetical protein
MGDQDSDFDLIWVLTDEEYDRRVQAGEPLEETVRRGDLKHLEIDFTSLARMRSASTPDWIIQGLASARVLVDRTGELTQALQDVVGLPPDRAPAEAAFAFDGYLNGFYRSMKAAKRGNELGARLQAAESLTYLVRTLFALESRRAPFHDRLTRALDTLVDQGWARGELHERFLEILRTSSPEAQVSLEDRVETLMRDRGHGEVIDSWGGEIERVKQR